MQPKRQEENDNVKARGEDEHEVGHPVKCRCVGVIHGVLIDDYRHEIGDFEAEKHFSDLQNVKLEPRYDDFDDKLHAPQRIAS